MSLWILLQRGRRHLQLTLEQRGLQLCGHTNPPVPGAAQVNPPGPGLGCVFVLSFITSIFSIAVDIQHSVGFRGTARWSDVYVTQGAIAPRASSPPAPSGVISGPDRIPRAPLHEPVTAL